MKYILIAVLVILSVFWLTGCQFHNSQKSQKDDIQYTGYYSSPLPGTEERINRAERKYHITTGVYTALKRNRLEYMGQPSVYMRHKYQSGFDFYRFTSEPNFEPKELSRGLVVRGSGTNVHDFYAMMERGIPDLRNYCELEIEKNEHGEIIGRGVYNQQINRLASRLYPAAELRGIK